MCLTLDYWEKQLILYAKGHYPRINYVADLKYFPANCYGIPLHLVDTHNESSMVIDLHEELCKAGLIHFKLRDFLDGVLRRARQAAAGDIEWDGVIAELLSEIQAIPVRNNQDELLIDLGLPDKKLFSTIKKLNKFE